SRPNEHLQLQLPILAPDLGRRRRAFLPCRCVSLTGRVPRSARSGFSGGDEAAPDFVKKLERKKLTKPASQRHNPSPGSPAPPKRICYAREESVNIVSECTVPEKILLAAYELEEQGQSPFSAEALIVASWQKFPRTFGLKGYADQYPDSNKVLTSIMGEKGLARRGWLAKMGQKLYTLTREGKQAVRRLLQGEETPPVERTTKLAREQEKFLLGLLANPAVEKFQQGLKLELTFADACRFWGISENLRGDALDSRLN